MRDLLDFLPWKASRLPQLPNTKANALFRDQFLEYCETAEWQTFIVEIATIGSNRFESNLFWGQTLDLEELLELAKSCKIFENLENLEKKFKRS